MGLHTFPPASNTMSLATHQRILQLRSDRDDLLRRISVGEDTPRVKQLLFRTKSTIASLEKQYNEELANDKAKKTVQKPRAPTSEVKSRDPLPSDMDLSCVDCASTFSFTGKDQVFYTKNNYKTPIRCTMCRDVKKNTKPEGNNIQCCGCKKDFFFSEAKAAIFEEKGWAAPKWCSPCKTEKNKKRTSETKA